MKKYVFLLVIILAACGYFWARNLNRIEVIRVGVECDYPPNNWEENRDTDSNVPLVNKEGYYAEGYDVQIAKIVADKIGAKLEVKKIAWQDLIPALTGREIDAIFSGMLDTEERRQKIAFSEVYEIEETEYAIIVNKKSKYADAEKLTDFYGAVLIGQKDTNLDRAINQIIGAVHMEPVDTVSEMLDKLIKHEVDGSVINLNTGRTYENAYTNLKVIQFPKDAGFVFDFKGICAGVRKHDATLLKGINSALSDLSRRDRQRIMDRTIAREWENIK